MLSAVGDQVSESSMSYIAASSSTDAALPSATSSASPSPEDAIAAAPTASQAKKPQLDHPFLGILQKRLRTLRKRLSKIEKYESDRSLANVHLNEDQLSAIQKKPEVMALIVELEDVLRQMEEKEAEVRKLKKKESRAQHLELQRTISAAVQEFRTVTDQQLAFLTRLFYAVNVILPVVPVGLVSRVEKEAMVHLQSTLIGLHMDPAVDPASMASHSHLMLRSLLSRSEDVVAVGSLTCKRVADLVEACYQFIDTPPVPGPTFMTEPFAVEGVQDGVVGPAATVDSVPAAHPISFMATSPASLMTKGEVGEAVNVAAERVTQAMEDLQVDADVVSAPTPAVENPADMEAVTVHDRGQQEEQECMSQDTSYVKPSSTRPHHPQSQFYRDRGPYRGRGRGRGGFRGNRGGFSFRGHGPSRGGSERPRPSKTEHPPAVVATSS